MAEIAAGRWPDGIPTSQCLFATARAQGYDFCPADGVRLKTTRLPVRGHVPGWQRGAAAAQALREQENLGAEPLSNQRLASMAGIVVDAVSDRGKAADFSFALDGEGEAGGHIVLHAPRETGRRFELARLLGDRIVGDPGGRLHPALNSYTYRQKVQRSFAAELLCPFAELDDMLGDDHSADAIEDAAQRFNVSQLTVRTVLVNHRRLGRDDLDGDPEAGLAA